jgi:hypothetical protein
MSCSPKTSFASAVATKMNEEGVAALDQGAGGQGNQRGEQ